MHCYCKKNTWKRNTSDDHLYDLEPYRPNKTRHISGISRNTHTNSHQNFSKNQIKLCTVHINVLQLCYYPLHLKIFLISMFWPTKLLLAPSVYPTSMCFSMIIAITLYLKRNSTHRRSFFLRRNGLKTHPIYDFHARGDADRLCYRLL